MTTENPGYAPAATEQGSPSTAATAATPVPAIQLPKGGGAIRGIGEKFGANPVTGTGSMSVPIATSPGRAGFGPQLSLSYDSGAGNGPYGFGWTLSLASITRKTDKGLPRYFDDAAGDHDGGPSGDVFILAGAEDLVPVYRQDRDGSWVARHPGCRCDEDGAWVRDRSGRMVVHEDEIDGYRVRRYRPRIEGLFARIERWDRIGAPDDVHWRSISRDNVLTVYGLDAHARIADPLDATRIFSWLICEMRDDKGNGMLFRYKAEDGQGVDLDQANERNRGPRDDPRRTANRYLKRIHYGNRTPLLDAHGHRPHFLDRADVDAQLAGAGWMFEVVFDYGEHDPDAPRPHDDRATNGDGAPAHPWLARVDPFSTYRAGFEVRTQRLCRRVLMFHHFPGAPDVGRDCLVRSTDLAYEGAADPAAVSRPVYTFLQAVTQTGYRREGDGYARRSMPPVEFRYSQARVQDTVEEVDAESLENLPNGLDGNAWRWTDLHGEGVPGILAEQGGAWFYKRNWSPLPQGHGEGATVAADAVRARFAPAETVALMPNATLAEGSELMDLDGDGVPDLVVMADAAAGVYRHDADEGWHPFRPFRRQPNRDLRDPNLRFVDLDGDGHADLLVTEDDALVWHASLAQDGFGPARRVANALDEEAGPRIVFADGTESIFLADLSGDGLTDILRIRNGEVCYWPNTGYGRFGSKVTMDNAPHFDHPDQFDPRRIRLADVDGSGTADILYLHRDGVRLYFNQSGNGWSRPHHVAAFPRIDDVANVVPVDLLGNGTVCLVWSSPLPADAGHPMRYVNLMGSKPHLLVGTSNNLGAETRIHYAPSTRFYLQDKRDGRPWVTRLPVLVHVVERIEILDHVGHTRFVTRYAYHHGHFDSEEREFRGFGMVEQWDTEQSAALAGRDLPADAMGATPHVPPVHTKTWFHTGAWLGGDRISDYFAGLSGDGRGDGWGEYFREPGLDDAEARAMLLPDTLLPCGLGVEEEREACRALKGTMLRQEVYADDAGPHATPEQARRARMPYTVTEQSTGVRVLQRRGGNRHAVFFTHARENIGYRYERNPADPRVQHDLTLDVDDYGNVLKRVSVGYGRRPLVRALDARGRMETVPNPGLMALPEADRAKQTARLVTYTENRLTNAIDAPGSHRTPLPAEAVTYELTGYSPTGPDFGPNAGPTAGPAACGADGVRRFRPADFVEPDPETPGRVRHRFCAPEVAYEAAASGSRRRRPIERMRTLYRRDDMEELLPLGEVQARALPGESYKQAFTAGLIDRVFRRRRHLRAGEARGAPEASHAPEAPEALLPDPAGVLGGQGADRGGYVPGRQIKAGRLFPADDPDGDWWIPSGRSFFGTDAADAAADAASAGARAAAEAARARRQFFLPRRFRDAFGHDTVVDYDADNLLMTSTRDALDNRVTVEANDYRVLQPRLVSDPNGNRTEVAFDILGLVAGTAVMGKSLPAPPEGDTLDGFEADLAQARLDAFFDAGDPRAHAAALLRGATTRIVYDLDRLRRTRQAWPDDPARWQPACAATLARETHARAPLPAWGLRIQLSFSYSDGFGREIQKKIQARPGPLAEGGTGDGRIASPRWIGSGWTVFNNKGKPVLQFEPFFSATHRFEFGVQAGVSPVLFYDPAGRVVATLHPNDTYEKVVFDPWRQATYDLNDTCAPRGGETGDPRSDPDIGGYVHAYFASRPEGWQTWYARRVGGALGEEERHAALRAAAHADTPSTAHVDVLGRVFLTVGRNRVACPGHDLDGTGEEVLSRVELDIEGNRRAVLDEPRRPGAAVRQRVVVRYDYDMLGNRIHQLDMDAGARWMLNDVGGKPIRTWDSRGHDFATAYDVLRRPLEQRVRGTFAGGREASDPRTLHREVVVGRIEYGESVPNAATLNLRGRALRHFDAAGVMVNARLDADGNPVLAYDFKGNLLCSTRRLASRYKDALPDWSQPAEAQLEVEAFEGSTRYDALNRPVQSVAPHGAASRINVVQPVFDETNLLERVDVWLERAACPDALLDPAADAPSPVGVARVDYDAKGQRRRIDYRNGTSTRYTYDPLTFRLARLATRRDTSAFPGDDPHPPEAGWHGRLAQNLRYTYDPAGNVTHIRDDAQQAIYFRNRRVDPGNDYVYDALYRLVQARGREHLGQANGGRGRLSAPGAFDALHARLEHPGDGNAMGRYVERYVYDTAGNFLHMQHRGSDPGHPGWTRGYDYLEPGLAGDGAHVPGNRLTRTTLSGSNEAGEHVEPYRHDAHGNMIRMPHLGAGHDGPNMHWDYKDQLRQADLGGGGTAFYVYDANGQRVRKVWEKGQGIVEERIYLGGFEIFRRRRAQHAAAAEEPDGAAGDAGTTAAPGLLLERDTLHLMDGRQRIALVETRTFDADGCDPAPRQLIRYQYANHLGSACLELDEGAQVISYEEYAPFGSSTYQAVRSQAQAAKRYRHTGKERDEESGFDYHGARYLAPWLGRWIAADPLGIADGLNGYAYGRDNPVRYTDPTGTRCDPNIQSCGPPTESTPLEEERQQSLPESKRYGPPNPFAAPEALVTPASGAPSSSSSPSVSSSSTALAISGTQFGVAMLVRPVDVNGNPLSGTYYLWSGAPNKAAAKAAAAQNGWLMQATPEHAAAETVFAAALRREAAVAFPGQTFTDQQLFSMAGSQLKLPDAEMRAIWDPPSAEVAWRAVLSGKPVQGNMVSPPGPDTVQMRIELPAVRNAGLLMGGAQVGAGALNFYGGTQEENPWLAGLGMGGGTLQVVGGGTWIAGAFRASAPVMSAGSKLSVVGAVVTAPITAVHAYEDIQSGDEYRQMRGTMNAVGIVAPPAAFIAAYNDVVVKPAAETFYEVARRDIANMLGVPLSWVY